MHASRQLDKISVDRTAKASLSCALLGLNLGMSAAGVSSGPYKPHAGNCKQRPCSCTSRHWDNPAVLEKLSAAMGDAFNADGSEAIEEGAAGAHNGGVKEEGAEDEEGEEEEPSVHSAAAAGAHSVPGVPRLTVERMLWQLRQCLACASACC